MRDTFSRYSLIVFIGNGKSENIRLLKCGGRGLTEWIDFPVTPGIISTDKANVCGAKVHQFCRDHNIALQTAIPWHRKGQEATARRLPYFRGTTQQIKDGRNNQKIEIWGAWNIHLCASYI